MGELAFDFVTGIRPPVSALPIDARRFADVKRRFREAKDSPTSGGAGDDDDARPLFAVGSDGNWQLDAFALLAAAGSGAWLSCAQVRELVDLFEPGAPRPSPPPARARSRTRRTRGVCSSPRPTQQRRTIHARCVRTCCEGCGVQ